MQTICNNAATLLLLLLLGGLDSRAALPGARIHLLASFLPAYALAAPLVENAPVELSVLLPAAEDPHDYQLSPRDLRRIHEADAVIMIGLGVEDWLKKAFVAGGHAPRLIDLSTSVRKDLLFRDGAANPHYWLDPVLAAEAVIFLSGELQKMTTEQGVDFASKGRRAAAELTKLDQDLRKVLAPVQGSSFLAYHDSFAYLGRRYGFEIAGVVEEAADIPPSPRQLARLHQISISHRARGLLGEKNEASRLGRQICRDFNLPLIELMTLETGLASPGVYETSMRANGQKLRAMLKAP